MRVPKSRPSSIGVHRFAGWFTLGIVLIILAGTLFPFHFSVEATASRRAGFFLFWFAPVQKRWLGWLLNVAMFLPFGFGLTWWARTRERQRLSSPLALALAGFLFSYSVEFLQLFVVTRDSSWDDVLMNTAGALVGWFIYERWGARLLLSAKTMILNVIEVRGK